MSVRFIYNRLAASLGAAHTGSGRHSRTLTGSPMTSSAALTTHLTKSPADVSLSLTPPRFDGHIP